MLLWLEVRFWALGHKTIALGSLLEPLKKLSFTSIQIYLDIIRHLFTGLSVFNIDFTAQQDDNTPICVCILYGRRRRMSQSMPNCMFARQKFSG